MPVRRVRRVIRKIDPWTVLKVSFVINVIAALVFVLGTWVSWSLIIQAGIPERLSDIADNLTITYEANGEQYFRVIVLLAVIGAIVMTGVFTLGAVLYNLIADLVGGVEITVLEETYNQAPQVAPSVPVRPARSRPVQRPVAGDAAGGGNGRSGSAGQEAAGETKPVSPGVATRS